MSLWVKFCGNTSLQDAMLAAEVGADAVGFVFAASPRRVTADRVATIIPQLPSSIEKIGVFVDASFDEIGSTVHRCGLTGVQIHYQGDPEIPVRLHERFGPGLRILRVLHFAPDLRQRMAEPAHSQYIDAILIDSRTATVVGGTGITFDWDAAQYLFRNAGIPLVVAGGLTPGNVSEAVRKLRPWGVDVVSGVEEAPGRKSPEKVREFLANARAAVSETL